MWIWVPVMYMYCLFLRTIGSIMYLEARRRHHTLCVSLSDQSWRFYGHKKHRKVKRDAREIYLSFSVLFLTLKDIKISRACRSFPTRRSISVGKRGFSRLIGPRIHGAVFLWSLRSLKTSTKAQKVIFWNFLKGDRIQISFKKGRRAGLFNGLQSGGKSAMTIFLS